MIPLAECSAAAPDTGPCSDVVEAAVCDVIDCPPATVRRCLDSTRTVRFESVTETLVEATAYMPAAAIVAVISGFALVVWLILALDVCALRLDARRDGSVGPATMTRSVVAAVEV